MTVETYDEITDQQAQQFLDRGYIVIEDCFADKEWADRLLSEGYREKGIDPQDRSTWTVDYTKTSGLKRFHPNEFAPRAWAAIADLLGGAERISLPERRKWWSDGFLINLSEGKGNPWPPPSPEVGGWHKDGDFFKHFLDSPEQGLLILIIWTDILPESGGTFFASDSIKPVAEFLLEHPEGVSKGFGHLVKKCHDFGEITARAGDIVLIHPYMLHTRSPNPSGRLRVITNPYVSLKEPMNFNREDPSEYSLVERKILNDLGVGHLDFKITGTRGAR